MRNLPLAATGLGTLGITVEEAAHDADALLRALYGDVATFNFPREGERGIKRPRPGTA